MFQWLLISSRLSTEWYLTSFSVLPPRVAVVQPLCRPLVTCSVTKCSLLKFLKCPQADVDLNILYWLFYLSNQVSAEGIASSLLAIFFKPMGFFSLSLVTRIFSQKYWVLLCSRWKALWASVRFIKEWLFKSIQS